MQRVFGCVLSVILCVACNSVSQAQNFLAVDQEAWPGRILSIRSSERDSAVFWQRGPALSDRVVPKIQSLTALRDGTIVFCSGLDRSVQAIGPSGEYELHHGGSLVRQVRTDSNGDLYWSGLETPIDNNPLPDGFITKRSATTGQVETLLTFSQGLVDNDWWGSFDVRDGRIFVATHHSPGKIYAIQESIPRLVATLPTAISAFRFESSTSALIIDGAGRLYRFGDFASDPTRSEVITERPLKLVDFLPVP